MTYIKDYLNKLSPLEPIPTDLKPDISSVKEYKAFIFDIYGTLLISSSGDVDEADPSTSNLNTAFKACNIRYINPNVSEQITNGFIKDIHNEIKDSHEIQKKQGNVYPEVVIEEIFETILNRFIANKKLTGDCTFENIRKLVFVFELASNKVWPMPAMKEILFKIHNSQKPLGIVSNAQFYTPYIVNHFLNNTYQDTESIIPFSNDLIQYSYKSKKGKPDTTIFISLLKSLKEKFDINPEEAVYIGNDMLKDIYTANYCGMDTILFAGDKRSLRLRSDDNRCKDLKPTYIITKLSQLEALI